MSILRFAMIFVLLFLAATAFWGGTVLITHAHGNPWGMMPLSLLAHSPFHSWLIPGMILFAGNGVLALGIPGYTLLRGRRCGLWSALQGFVLLGWLTTECLLLRMMIWPHYLYGSLALFLIVSGFALQSGNAPRAVRS